MKKQKKIFLATIFVIIIPLLCLVFLVCIGYIDKNPFMDKEFWLAYMAYFGTVAVSGTALWQNAVMEEQNRKLLDEQQQQNLVLKNMTTEHPVLKITSVKLYGAFGKREIEAYQCSEHQENYYLGTRTRGKLEIKVENIGNGLAREIEHVGLYGFEAKGNSKSIAPNSEGVILIFFESELKKDKSIDICYQNIRNFQYSQKINIIIEEEDHWKEDYDEEGQPIEGSQEWIGSETHVYVVLDSQKAIGFVEGKEVDARWTD